MAYQNVDVIEYRVVCVLGASKGDTITFRVDQFEKADDVLCFKREHKPNEDWEMVAVLDA